MAFVASLVVPVITNTYRNFQAISALKRGRSIHLAIMQMAHDGRANNDKELGWPGDLKANGSITTLSDFVQRLVDYDYLKLGDLRIFSGPEYPPSKDGIFADKNSIFKVYLVKEDDPPDTVFLMTKRGAFGGTGFVVVFKNGYGGRYKEFQRDDPPNRFKFPGNTTEESAENCLNPEL